MTVIGALDIGGSKILAGLVRPDGRVLTSERSALREGTPAQVVRQATSMLTGLARTHHAHLRGVGCSVPGPLDSRSGIVRFSPNLGWQQVALAGLLRRRMRVPVAIDDDARCAAIGEWWRGSGRGANCLLYLVVGTGVGSGLILDGRVVRGSSDAAGEIGHTIIRPGGPLCSCGQRGCLEAVAAGPALVRDTRAAMHARRLRRTDLDGGTITAESIVTAALNGNPRVRQIVDRAGDALGLVVANAVTLLNLDRIILGGGVGRAASQLWLPQIRRDITRYALRTAARGVRITTGALGETAALVGAAWVFRDRERRASRRSHERVSL